MLKLIKQEINLFAIALTFFSRIPSPVTIDFSAQNLSRANRYFALVGWILGGLVALVFSIANLVFSDAISLWLAMAASLLLTGCFHEDGLADMADGFGGGYTLEKKLNIMKDSRLGTYGASILIFALAGKFLLLAELLNYQLNAIWLYLPFAYALSRTVAASLIFDMQYQSEDLTSKSKPLANQQSLTELMILIVSILPAIFWLATEPLFAVIICMILFRWCFKAYLQRQIQGYTGDCLGAAQQIAELLIYLVLLASLNLSQ
ncbi:adenosylcobinamide-GDP ribazoletransferase [Catenovulum sp. 2E275]|uniref:adenosylcobinamide-GDP ribazoletransferase n=1 Tax=Catenovulum sp. 2E275 TaxID=2980497 RepID=UPI0021D1DB64|nr:adenosylcobinamide-GDP ribazoletransferase [Catenovulum sp. 2E275]MCU4674648.1 adenosylcobinamide-GDP ribazoletransferase [Catenovulum sp. 2E275]